MDEEKLREYIDEKKMLYARFIFEVQGKPRDYVKESLEKLIDALKNEQGVIISDVKYEDIIELDEGIFSYLADAGVLTKDFETMVTLSLRYGPSIVHFMEPEKITIDIRQMQNVLSDIGRTIQEIAAENIKLKLRIETLQRKMREMKS